MENVIPFKIQLVSILGSFAFLFIIGKLILRGKLREEYAILWLICTFFLILFSIWRNGLELIADFLDVNYAPSLIFLGTTGVIFVFLLHLSVVNSKQQKQIKNLSQELALMKNKKKEKE